MPLQRRLPKRGFRSSSVADTAEVRLHELTAITAEIVDLEALKLAGIVPARAKRAKVIVSGKLDRAVTLRGISLTKGARAAVDAAGGKVEE
jgi:large subunit ribosomal protein L15